jgi:hypothetical protein
MIAHFSLRLICGMSLMWCLMPRGQVTSGFFRIQMLVVLGLSVLSTLTLGMYADAADEQLSPLLGMQTTVALCVVLAVAAFVGSVMWTLERRRAGGWFAAVIAIVSLGVLLMSFPRIGPMTDTAEWLRLLSDVSSAAILGGAMTAMLLGHWYLTAPTMSIEPLKRLTCYFGSAAVLRLLVSAAGLALVWGSIDDSTHWLWLCLRWTAGIAGPLAVAFMTWQILKYRNTQAATGVLFVGVIVTFIGEMTGSLLYQALWTPL